ncbi:ATP-binding cassette domain-containing protein [Halorubrum sp. JWXQ-INN 858]|uniref:ABC transporter ATP-binding protein n=1 Tax=Halorubrum sp. JWXQ-INN 858 TaxID=2690782 RepID=UPI00135731C9|nr:ABC transporter ATP-binding protein [Halorubrum sp. JWXQ-INN 858]MWV63594.1 ATP-binding cassette domain-containing protein [Halorubrum sp. JWXQ-INN 858]
MASEDATARDRAPPAVELDGVSRRYGDAVAVDDVDLTVREGEFFTLVGPSGCGKTTTLRLIAGFEQPTAGAIRFRGEDVSGVPPEGRDVGVVFQNYALFPHMTVGENVGYGLNFADPPGGVGRKERVRELLELVDLGGAEDRDPDSLSGGQQQRVAMARALATGPDVLLLDEPMSALDARLRERLRVQVKAIQRELSITTVYVTHDQEEALAVSDRVAVMRAGAPEQVAPPRTVYRRPTSRFVAEFVGDNNVFDGVVTRVTDGPRETGDPPASVGSSPPDRGSVSSGATRSDGAIRSGGATRSGGTEDANEPGERRGTDGTARVPDETEGRAGRKPPADRVADVDVGGDPLRVAVADDVAVGDRVTFCVRPENLRIGGGEAALRAPVESAEFLGETTRVHLDWGGRAVVVRTPDPLSGTVAVGFDPTDAHVVAVERPAGDR